MNGFTSVTEKYDRITNKILSSIKEYIKIIICRDSKQK